MKQTLFIHHRRLGRSMIAQGIYEQYKSTAQDRRNYQVLLLSHDEETHNILVHYQPLYWTMKVVYIMTESQFGHARYKIYRKS